MSGPSFFQTRMGQTFFEGTVPRLYRAIDRLADALGGGGRREYKVVQVQDRTPPSLEEEFNKYGAEGFRVIKITEELVTFERVVPRGGEGR